MKNYFLSIAVIFFMISSINCAMKPVNCPPKFMIYKNINKAYPVFARDFNLSMKNSLSTAKKIEDTASVTLKQNVIKLRENLNNVSSRVEILTKSNLMSYYSGICDENIRKSFSEFQVKLADMTLQLTQIETKLGPSKALSGDVNKQVDDALKISNELSEKVR